MMQGLPAEQRELLDKFTHFHRVMLEPYRNCEEKIRYWMSVHPGRGATHERISEDIGVCRETVTRILPEAHENYTQRGWVLGHRQDDTRL